jgi:hypothetical protein
MTDIMTNIGLIVFWFGSGCDRYFLFMGGYIRDKKGWLGETSSKVVYFATFVILAAIVFKLPLL